MIGNMIAAQLGVAAGIPTSPVAGSSLWLDANDASTFTYSSGSVVSQWNDKSGNSRNFSQSTVSLQPSRLTNTQNGKAVVNFGTPTDYKWLSKTAFGWAESSFTVFLVIKPNTGGYFQNIFSSDTLYGTSLAITATGNYYSVFNTGAAAYPSNLAYTTSNADVTTWKSSGQSGGSIAVYLRKNGVAASSVINAGYTNQNTKATLGAANSTEPFLGYVCEVLVYPSQLSSTDIETNETYLKNKWGTP